MKVPCCLKLRGYIELVTKIAMSQQTSPVGRADSAGHDWIVSADHNHMVDIHFKARMRGTPALQVNKACCMCR